MAIADFERIVSMQSIINGKLVKKLHPNWTLPGPIVKQICKSLISDSFDWVFSVCNQKNSETKSELMNDLLWSILKTHPLRNYWFFKATYLDQILINVLITKLTLRRCLRDLILWWKNCICWIGEQVIF
jgi:hypothetical protein